MHWCFGIRVKGPTILYGDHQQINQSSTLIEVECKKRHVLIAYHNIQECAATRIVNLVKVSTKMNLSDFLTKDIDWGNCHLLTGMLFGWWMVEDWVNMRRSSLS